MRAAYEAAPRSWVAGPEPVYAALARALVAHVAPLLPGARVLDLGAGTGVAGRAALEAGAAHVVAADLALAPLRQCWPQDGGLQQRGPQQGGLQEGGLQQRGLQEGGLQEGGLQEGGLQEGGPPLRPVVADAAALPFRDQSFSVVLAAFSLTHAGNLGEALGHAHRVGGVLAASAFAPGWGHPAKAAVDAVLARFGYRPPAWYLTFKQDTEPRLSDARLVRELALAAGYRRVQSSLIAVPTGLSAPAQLAAWRLGMAHIAPFAASLDARRQADLRRTAEEAVSGCEPLVVGIQVHVAS